MTVDRTDDVGSRQGAWHQSTLETLLDGCSWQYFLTYVLAVPADPKPSAAVGIAYHAALEQHELARLHGEKNGLPLPELLAFAEQAVREQIDDDELVKSAQAAVHNWYGAPLADGSPSHRDWLLRFKPVAVEPYLNVPLVEGAKPVAGWADGVYEDDNGLFLVDHKTAKSFSRWGHDGEEHRRQATLYSVALALDPAWDTNELVRMVYLVARTSRGKAKNFEPARRVIVQPDMLDVATLGERVRMAEKIAAEEEYARNPKWVLCSQQWCPFYEGCMVTGELAGTPATVRARLAGAA